MLPNQIIHLSKPYDLRHLHTRHETFRWRCQDGQEMDFNVRVRCSNHSISEELIGCAPDGAGCLRDYQGKPRIFAPDRYAWSKELPKIIDGLFAKPATQIRLTTEKNWYIFQLHMHHPLPNGERYYCFLRLWYSKEVCSDPPTHQINLQVESAYSRSNPPLTPHGNERAMFGRLVERLMLEKTKGQPKLP